MKDRSMGRKILNIAIEVNSEEFHFANQIHYEPSGPLAIDYYQPQVPQVNHVQTNGKVNGSSAGVSKPLDYKQALISKAPAPAPNNNKIGSSRGFQLPFKFLLQISRLLKQVFVGRRL